jgi:adenine-specific DNA-methyltransferase
MARKPKRGTDVETEAYKYSRKEATRKNIPESGLVDVIPRVKETTTKYCWDPRESPQLVWAGKAGLKRVEVEEQTSIEIPLVNLHIHERVSTEAILRSVKRQDAQRSLFADPELDFTKEVQFYKHDVDWSNRMILGDSLLVMNSLLEREGMRGSVQCIYMDPPYGIKYASNFQPRIDQRDVKDGKDADVTREVMQVQAFRDTWELGVHSYLTYLRDRLLLCRELLKDTGSIFVQIGDENVHRVRCLMDEVFGEQCCVNAIVFQKSSGRVSDEVDSVYDVLLWYAKSREDMKFRKVYRARSQQQVDTAYNYLETADGTERALSKAEADGAEELPRDARRFRPSQMYSQTGGESSAFTVTFRGSEYDGPASGGWRTNVDGIRRLRAANRILERGKNLAYKMFADDFGLVQLHDIWTDVLFTAFGTEKAFAVQTAPQVIARCILMTTDPGDLVLDPTCGSGTTAYVAEQWGRRWITMDTSRVALAIARHRLMTAAFEYYALRYPSTGVSGSFRYKTVPHISLKSIAQNPEIDKIAEDFRPKLEAALGEVNRAFDRDWKDWEVPREPSPSSQSLRPLLDKYWSLKREMQARIDASIARNAPTEELVDQPEVDRGIVRVSGPFTVEAVPNVGAELSVEVEEKVFDDELQMQIFEPIQSALTAVEARNVSAYISDMIEKLRKTGVVAKSGAKLSFQTLRPIDHAVLHAEGEISGADSGTPVPGVVSTGVPPVSDSAAKRVGVMFGPQNGAVSEAHVKEALQAGRRYDVVLICGYEFTPTAQEMALAASQTDWQVLLAYVAPDTVMADLLKDTKASQLFTMIGEPDVVVYRHGDPELAELVKDAERRGAKDVKDRAAKLEPGEMFLELRGVDVYDPVTGEVKSDVGENVHAVFIDQDYDGKSFCICQALFPNKRDSWDKIARNLKGAIDEDAFAAFRTLVSLPFKPGTSFGKDSGEGRVQVKVIDQRGNALVKTVRG